MPEESASGYGAPVQTECGALNLPTQSRDVARKATDHTCAIAVKVWAFACALTVTIADVSLASSACLSVIALCHIAWQRKGRLAFGFLGFYGLLSLLLYAIRFHGLHMVVFSEFYVLLFWNLMPVFIVAWDLITSYPGRLSSSLSKIHAPTQAILGLLVVFRFFPTMRSELASILSSMRNRRLTGIRQVVRHPVITCEYVIVPLLLRCLQIADQLAVSAVTRGAEAPGVRGSYHERPFRVSDGILAAVWTLATVAACLVGAFVS